MANDLDGKVILVTGATEGIGKAAAKEFAARGAILAIVGRNAEKTERVAAEIRAASGSSRVETYVADVSSLAGVRALAAAFRAKHDRLDVLVNNAGAVFADYQTSADGFEMTFALNHLAYFLLTHELRELLEKTPGARVVSTSSDAHKQGKLDLDTVARRPSRKAGFSAYGDSKLANILFTRELARRLRDKGVTANCFHPGFVATGFGQNNAGFLGSAIKITASLFARTPEKGAETLVWLATSPEAERYSGEYFHDRAPGRTSRRAKDDQLAAALWSLSEKLCGVS